MNVIRVLNTTAIGKSGYIFTGTAPRKNLVRRSTDKVFPRFNLRVVAVQPLNSGQSLICSPVLSLFVYLPCLNRPISIY